MTSKQRAYLKGLAMTMDPIFQFGKNSLTPENTAAIALTGCSGYWKENRSLQGI